MSDWTDWTQNRRIADAEEALDAERRARSRLSEQMRQQQGNLQGQIDRLTKALVALIEHEDIRAELGQHADAAACRRYARDVVATVVVTGGAAVRTSAESADVPGYWLAAAVRGIAATARGEEAGEALLAEAAQRDPLRTALFRALLAAQTRDARWAPASLAPVLPDQSAVTVAQRQVWLAVADGRLAGEAELAAALARQVEAAGEAADEQLADWLRSRTPKPAGGLPSEHAAAQLARLDDVLRGVRTPVEQEQRQEDEERASEDPLADCLRSLVDEGAPAEDDILERMAAVRADLGFLDGRAGREGVSWSATAGDVVELLLADLAEPTDSGRHRAARQVLAPRLLAAADRLAAAAAVPVAATRSVNVAGETIDVTGDGTARRWQPDVLAAVERRTPRTPYLVPVGGAALAVGLVALGLAFVAGGFAVLAVFGLAGGAAALGAAFSQQRRLKAAQEATLGSGERSVSQAAATIVDETTRSRAASAAAQGSRDGVRAGLGDLGPL